MMEKEKVDQHNTKKRLSMLTATTTSSLPTTMITPELNGDKAATNRALHPSELTHPKPTITSTPSVRTPSVLTTTPMSTIMNTTNTTNTTNMIHNNNITGMNKISLPTTIPSSSSTTTTTTTTTTTVPSSSAVLSSTLSTMSIAPPPPPMPVSIPIKESRKRPEIESAEQHENVVRTLLSISNLLSHFSSIQLIPRLPARERNNLHPPNNNNNNNNNHPLRVDCLWLPHSRWPFIQQPQ